MIKMFNRSYNSTIGGVCQGLAEYFNLDGLLVKILFIGLIFTPFPIISIYLLLWILTSKK